jgi:DNA-binding NarL/FixJ family response regulator
MKGAGVSEIRVFLVDDHPVVWNGLKALVDVEADMEVAGAGYDGETAVRRAIELPDVVVMNVSMPGMSGTEATAQIPRSFPKVRVVAPTTHENRGYLWRCSKTGGAGTCCSGRRPPTWSGRSGTRRPATRTYTRRSRDSSRPARCSRAQTRPGRICASARSKYRVDRRGVLKQADRRTARVSVKTVETYKARGMEKLGARSRVDVVKYASERGWLTGG